MKQLWLSEDGIPQQITFDISGLTTRSPFYKCIGWTCWHAYSSNPSVVEILVSEDNNSFRTWIICHAELKAGTQIFAIDPLPNKYSFIQFIIRETYGASKTYMNQVLLFEDCPIINQTKRNYTPITTNRNYNNDTNRSRSTTPFYSARTVDN